MSNLVKNSEGKWSGSVSFTKQTNTIEIPTAGKFVDSNIVIETTQELGSLNNEATTGVTYAENKDANTVIPAGGNLYINAGYYPNTKISLGHFIPDDANAENAGTAHIRSGYEAYDTNGNKLIGTLVDVTPKFTGGAVTATAGGSVTTAPKVTIEAEGSLIDSTSYGVTGTKPAGTDGVNYLTVNGKGTPTNGTVKTTADATRTAVTYNGAATGYINVATGTTASAKADATQNTSNVTVTPTVTDNFDPYYMPIVTSSVTGGAVTATASGSVEVAPKVKPSIAGTVLGVVSETKPTGTDGTDFYTIDISATVTDGKVVATAKADRTAISESHGAGAIQAHNGVSIVAGSDTKNVDVAVKPTAEESTKYYITSASRSASVSSHTVTKATAKAGTSVSSSSASYSTTGVKTSAPASGAYLTIAPTISTTAGSASAVAKGTTTGGFINAGDSTSTTDTKSVEVTTSFENTRYIPIYEGGFSVA